MDTFRLEADFSVTRESDGETMANYDPKTGEITYTHQSREKNYGAQIEELIAQFVSEEPEERGESPTENPNPNFQAPLPSHKRAAEKVADEQPPRHPQIGTYTDGHLLYDQANLGDKEFNKKWGGKMHRCAAGKVKRAPDYFGQSGEAILARLVKLNK